MCEASEKTKMNTDFTNVKGQTEQYLEEEKNDIAEESSNVAFGGQPDNTHGKESFNNDHISHQLEAVIKHVNKIKAFLEADYPEENDHLLATSNLQIDTLLNPKGNFEEAAEWGTSKEEQSKQELEKLIEQEIIHDSNFIPKIGQTVQGRDCEKMELEEKTLVDKAANDSKVDNNACLELHEPSFDVSAVLGKEETMTKLLDDEKPLNANSNPNLHFESLDNSIGNSQKSEIELNGNASVKNESQAIVQNNELELDSSTGSLTKNNNACYLQEDKLVHDENLEAKSAEIVADILNTAEKEAKSIWNSRCLRSNGSNSNNCTKSENINKSNKDGNPNSQLHKSNQNDTKIHNLSARDLNDLSPEVNHKTDSNLTKLHMEPITSKTVHENDPHTCVSLTSQHEEIDPDTICGIGKFKPEWLQKYATSRMYLILYSIIGVVQGSYHSYTIAILSTLEKRYAFESKISGIIMTADEVTPLFLGIFVGYFGGKAHRPRMIALGMFLGVICCFISALPYFLYGSQQLTSFSLKNMTDPEMCTRVPMDEHCDNEDRPPTFSAVLCLVIASLLKGFGNLAYYAVGLTYLDDNSKKKNTPIYFAFGMTLRLFGPTCGFLMSSQFLKYYENPLVDPGFGTEDPRWVGAWWMGFVLQGILILIFTFPIALFPRRLPNQYYTDVEKQDETVAEQFSGLFSALKRLAKNPLYIFLVLYVVMAVHGSIGYYIMLPRYMENQFRLSASDASLYSGPPGLVALMVATMAGGLLLWKYRPSSKIVTMALVLQEVISALGFLFLMLPQCEKVQMYNSGMNEEGLNLVNECNANCLCSQSDFTPICGLDGKTSFFSPCFAGCTEILTVNDTQIFGNCSCSKDLDSKFTTGTFESGFCRDENCWSQAVIYVISLPIIYCIGSIMRVGYSVVLMRSVDPKDKSVALGTLETMICLMAFVPCPMLIGAIVDSTCLIWEKSCNETGNCWFYDMDQFKYLLHGISASFTGMAALCMLAVFFLRRGIRNLYEEEGIKPEAENVKKIKT